MNETDYHRLADQALGAIAQTLEKADQDGALELEPESALVTITLESGKQFIVSKHAPTRQIWLSSPVSGGLHFAYDETYNDWHLSDGRTLTGVLYIELGQLGIVL